MRRRPLREQLAVAKAQLRAFSSLVKAIPAASVQFRDPDQFVALSSVYGRPVTQALDGRGQVWESVSEKSNGEYRIVGWVRVGMERR